ncbi:hypothetical protein BKA63DRAFT_567394 [Paraphoma chrysanthemicola]|nr:hypothetical protein BKA63DRAFT_567394 [Paraphoma chrysanthemicola]
MAIPVAATPIVKEPELQAVICTHTGTALPEGRLRQTCFSASWSRCKQEGIPGPPWRPGPVLAFLPADASKHQYQREDEAALRKSETFETIVYWLYSTRFWSPTSATKGKIPLSCEQILAVYFCAHEHGMQTLQNATLTLLYQKLTEDWKAPTAHLSVIYTKTAAGSLLRKLVVDFMAQTWRFDIEPNRQMLPHAFLIDVLNVLRDLGKAPGSGIKKQKWFAEMNESFCGKYHDHGELVSRKS